MGLSLDWIVNTKFGNRTHRFYLSYTRLDAGNHHVCVCVCVWGGGGGGVDLEK